MEHPVHVPFTLRLLVLGALGIAALVAYIATPWVAHLALRTGAVDLPSERKIHERAMPRWGGLAILWAFLIALALAWEAASLLGFSWVATPAEKQQFIGVVVGALVVAMVGALDDLYDLSPWLQLVGQGIAATTALLLGVKIEFITDPFSSEGGVLYLRNAGTFLTLFWIIGITKAIDLIDGIDGLAAGIAAIAAATMALIALAAKQPHVALLGAALAGGSIGFLRHNFNPARIFMGSVGAYVLGFVLATSAIVGVMKIPMLIALFVPILALGVPIFDTAFAIIRRAVQCRPIFAADRGHVHHRLLNLGLSQRQTVLLLYSVTLCLCLAALSIFYYGIR